MSKKMNAEDNFSPAYSTQTSFKRYYIATKDVKTNQFNAVDRRKGSLSKHMTTKPGVYNENGYPV